MLTISVAHAQTTTEDLQNAYNLCTKRYINRDKSIDAKWQKGYESCDKIILKYEDKQKKWNDTNKHKLNIDTIAK